jgi:hypothetical protein
VLVSIGFHLRSSFLLEKLVALIIFADSKKKNVGLTVSSNSIVNANITKLKAFKLITA